MSASTTSDALVERHARTLIDETLEDTPITVIQGARQTGKSTLLRQVIGDRGGQIVNLDVGVEYDAAMADPDAYVRRRTEGILAIDEIQRVPRLIRALKAAVDEDRRPGRFLITGSADLLHVPGTEESLAGRAETIELYGLSQGEVRGVREVFIDRAFDADADWLARRGTGMLREDYVEQICAGAYPEARRRDGRRRHLWLDNYLARAVSADARDIAQFAHLDRLTMIVQLIAASNAGELVNTRISDPTGIPQSSVGQYIDLLASLYIIHKLPAWGGNLTARVVGRPKVALLDTGLASRLINVTPAALKPGAVPHQAGGLFEAFVAGELRRQSWWSQQAVQLGHFRDRNGAEVDLILEDNARNVVGIEVKASGSVSGSEFRTLRLLQDRLGSRFRCGIVLYTGSRTVPFGTDLWAVPLSALWEDA